MKRLLLLFLPFFIYACHDDIVIKNTPENVFQAFWNTMDEKYIYFQEKQIDWDSIYTVYYPRVQAAKGEDEVYEIMKEIIPQFKDSHLAVYKNSNESIGYYPDSTCYYYIDSRNKLYNFMVFRIYNGSQHFITFQHQTNKYAYVQWDGLNDEYDDNNFITELNRLHFSGGLILDMRNFTGGYLENSFKMASLFYRGNRTILYKSSKKSPLRNDFCAPVPVSYVGRGVVPDTIPVIVLTNTLTYSAGNAFAYIMHTLPNCITVGAPTGGGGGPIYTVSLPNGWLLTYPAIKYFSSTMENMEYGLKPDYYVHYDQKKDTIADLQLIKALALLDSIKSKKY